MPVSSTVVLSTFLCENSFTGNSAQGISMMAMLVLSSVCEI
jgi:hypothetical protein